MRGTRLEVDLNALKNNVKKIQSKLKPETKTIAIVKADSYGLGANHVAKHIEQDVWAFGVATVEEACGLRKNGIKKPVLMMYPFFENEIKDILENNLIPTVTDIKRAEILNKAAKKMNTQVTVHIKIDTGMGRIGLPYDTCFDEILEICNKSNINVKGIYTHFPNADLLDKEFCHEQVKRFDDFTNRLEQNGVNIPIKHMANSSATVIYESTHKNAIRPGLLMYGTYPTSQIKENFKVDTVATFIAKIIFTKTVKSGETVSYGRTFTAERNTRVGVLGVGYADGYLTLNSSKAFVYVKGRFSPVLGRVCMDYTMIDITDIPEANEGDDVILYGKGGEDADYYAEKMGLIPYEALTTVSKRVTRVYLK